MSTPFTPKQVQDYNIVNYFSGTNGVAASSTETELDISLQGFLDHIIIYKSTNDGGLIVTLDGVEIFNEESTTDSNFGICNWSFIANSYKPFASLSTIYDMSSIKGIALPMFFSKLKIDFKNNSGGTFNFYYSYQYHTQT